MHACYYAILCYLAALLIMVGCSETASQSNASRSDVEAVMPSLQETKTTVITPIALKTSQESTSTDESQISLNRQILFTKFPGYQIYTINQDGSQLTQLTNEVTDSSFIGLNYSPTWSPDGTKIAFHTTRKTHESDSSFNTSKPVYNSNIYIMNANGSNQTRITTNPEGDFNPSWSPDGTKIAFIGRQKECNGQSEQFSLFADIYTVNIDDLQQTRITTCWHVSTIDWSPDGQKIVFSTLEIDPVLRNDMNIYVVNIDGSDMKRLTIEYGEDISPKWSPDGQKIAFMSRRDGTNIDRPFRIGDIYVMNADGSEQTNITQTPWHEAAPSWSPDGKSIVYEAIDDETNNHLYTMDADGKFQTPITTTITLQGFSPEFHP